MDDDDLQVGQAALIALCQIGGEAAHTALLNALQGEVTAPLDETADAKVAAAFPTSTLEAMGAARVSETAGEGDAVAHRQRIRPYAARLLNQYDLPQAQALLLQRLRVPTRNSVARRCPPSVTEAVMKSRRSLFKA